MPARIAVAFALGVLALAGCGGTKKAATIPATTTSLPPGAEGVGTSPPVKSVSYRVQLSGTNGSPHGAPGAAALGVLIIKASSLELCWQFSGLTNVTAPTRTRIYRSLTGSPGVDSGVPLGSAYKPAGCIREPAAFLGLLGAHPQNFFVSIDNAQFPQGAVRGRP